MSVLAEINRDILVCSKCRLHESRTNAVPGEGPSDAEILFIGEGPGFYEDQQGRPFVGASGRLLEKFLASIGMAREQVFIANVIKCRPPNNRDPLPAEIEACAPYLEQQIETIDPRIIVTLGRFSMARYFPGTKITKIHGRARRDGNRVYLPLYHPAYVLRNRRAMAEAEADFRKIPRLLARLKQLLAEESSQDPETVREQVLEVEPEKIQEEPSQLRLF